MTKAAVSSLFLASAVLMVTGCSSSTEQLELPSTIELGAASVEQEAVSTEQAGDQEGLADQGTTSSSDNSGESSVDNQDSSVSETNLDFVADDAELEIEDQRGDGTTVQIDEVKTSLQSGLLVIFDRSGRYLGAAKVSSTVQPVSIELENPISSSQELIGQLFADNGNGVYDSKDLEVIEAYEDEREIIYEDFEYEMN